MWRVELGGWTLKGFRAARERLAVVEHLADTEEQARAWVAEHPLTEVRMFALVEGWVRELARCVKDVALGPIRQPGRRFT